MGRLWMTMAVALLTSARASGSEPPTRVLEARDPADVERLESLLSQRESELEQMRGRLRVLDDEQRWLAEAESLGIVDVVRRSALTERVQGRVAVAIVREAHANGLDPLLVVAVIRTESAFDAYAVSGVGALGLMQMMPTTGTFLATQRGTTLKRPQSLFDAELNVELGTAYLASLLREFGTTEAALIAYNAGPSLAKRILRNPASRRRFAAGYPRDVIGEWRRLRATHASVFARRDVEVPARAVADGRLHAEPVTLQAAR